MAKYVCDFEQVKAQGEKLCKIAGDLSSAISTYSSASSSSLSSWQGNAATQFNQSNSSQIKTYTDNAQYINSFGKFVKEAAESIEKLDNELAGLSI